MHRYKVYLKVMTPLLSGSKGCLVYVCSVSAECVCVLLTAVAGRRGRQTPPWAGRWSYFHKAHWESQYRLGLETGNDNRVDIYADNLALGLLTVSWGNAAPGRHQELSPRSGCCSGLCDEEEDQRISQENGNWKKKKSHFPVGVLTPLSSGCHLHRKMRWMQCPCLSLANKEEANVVWTRWGWVPALSHI